MQMLLVENHLATYSEHTISRVVKYVQSTEHRPYLRLILEKFAEQLASWQHAMPTIQKKLIQEAVQSTTQPDVKWINFVNSLARMVFDCSYV